MLRKLALVLAVVLPLAAQLGETPVTRVDVVVTDEQGNRIRGLDAGDFDVSVNGERRAIESFDEFSPDAKPGPAVTDTMFVSLVPPVTPTPPRRLVLLYSGAAGEAAANAFIEKNQRPGDSITTIPEISAPRIASAIVDLARHPGKKALLVFGEASDKAVAFARRRGVSLYDNKTIANAAEDLTSYYSLTFRSTGAPVQIRTTRQYTVRPTAVTAPLPPEDAVSDAVIAQHAGLTQPNELGIQLAAEPGQSDGGGRRMKLHVLIPIERLSLVREGGDLKGGFDVYLSLGDDNGGFSPVTKRTHAIAWPAGAREKAGQRTIDYAIDIVVAPARRRISVGVIDHRSKKTGYQRIEVPR